MNKYALVGRNILHSKSPEIYKLYLLEKFHYDLLDFSNESDIPSLVELMKKYNGLNITSPYKTHFIREVELVGDAKKLSAINCIKKTNEGFFGINTDYLAIVDLLNNFTQKNKFAKILVLGDGVMASVTELALNSMSLSYEKKSRKTDSHFVELDLVEYSKQEKSLIINCCSREYIYSGSVSSDIFFWDLNYDLLIHKEHLSKNCIYEDGYSLLNLQAKYAASFWTQKNFA